MLTDHPDGQPSPPRLPRELDDGPAVGAGAARRQPVAVLAVTVLVGNRLGVDAGER